MAQIQARCLWGPFPLEQEVEIEGGAQDTPLQTLQGTLWGLLSTAGSDSQSQEGLSAGDRGAALSVEGRVLPGPQLQLWVERSGSTSAATSSRASGSRRRLTDAQYHSAIQTPLGPATVTCTRKQNYLQTHPEGSNSNTQELHTHRQSRWPCTYTAISTISQASHNTRSHVQTFSPLLGLGLRVRLTAGALG